MALVRIIYVPDKTLTGPDLDRIGTIEDVPDELARPMVAGGEAVYVDGSEVEPAAQPQSAPQVPVVGVPVKTRDELGTMTKADLTRYAEQRQIAIEAGATKADLVEALAPTDLPAPDGDAAAGDTEATPQ